MLRPCLFGQPRGYTHMYTTMRLFFSSLFCHSVLLSPLAHLRSCSAPPSCIFAPHLLPFAFWLGLPTVLDVPYVPCASAYLVSLALVLPCRARAYSLFLVPNGCCQSILTLIFLVRCSFPSMCSLSSLFPLMNSFSSSLLLYLPHLLVLPLRS